MGVESKIREMLAKGKEVESALNEETQELDEAGAAENLKPNATAGDSSNPTQGNSNPNPEIQDLSGTGDKHGGLTSAIGPASASKVGDAPRPANSGAGQAPNYDGGEDTASVVAQPSSEGIRTQKEEEEVEDEVIAEDEVENEEEVVSESEVEEVESEEEDAEVSQETETEEETLFENDIQNLFADEEHLSEEFKVKAAELFETVVTARLANEIESIQKELEEQSQIERETFKEEMVGKIDQYLNYVAENWMKENELAIERGLRTEITEDFIKSLKTVFAEHYIEVPQDKYDVLGEMQDEIEELKKKLNESVEAQINLTTDRESLMRSKIIGEISEDLTLTEQEKLTSLVEDVAFGSAEMFAEKVTVVKENYFPKQETVKEESESVMTDTVPEELIEEGSAVSRYAQAISRQVKK
tara:strand:- start:733 stop:1977 length:1245 start_codon:yes stop_codon:yes gene_type:complete